MESKVDLDLQTYIGLGFKEDCQKLIQEYCAQNTLRFSSFARVWKDTNFTLIYSGRPGFADLLEFVEEVLHVAKQFLINENEELNVRIAGLYLLYGLYFKQPTNRYVKIRMTYSDWKAFNDLVCAIRAGNHFDALFISCKLQASRAFVHVVADRQYGLEKPYRKYFEDQISSFCNVKQFSLNKSLTESIVDTGFLSSLELINEKYYRAKCALPGGSGIEPESSLSLVNREISEQMKLDYEKALSLVEVTEAAQDRTDKPEDENVADKHAKIRKKAFRHKQLKSVEITDDVVSLFKKPVKRKR